jgi:hypothetical protein
VAVAAAPAIEAVLALEALGPRRAGGPGPRFELRYCGLEVVDIGHEPLLGIFSRRLHLALDFAHRGLLLLEQLLCPARTRLSSGRELCGHGRAPETHGGRQRTRRRGLRGGGGGGGGGAQACRVHATCRCSS